MSKPFRVLTELSDKELEEIGKWVASKANDYIYAQHKAGCPFSVYIDIVSYFKERKFE